MGPNPNAVYPNEAIKQVVYIKNVINCWILSSIECSSQCSLRLTSHLGCSYYCGVQHAVSRNLAIHDLAVNCG